MDTTALLDVRGLGRKTGAGRWLVRELNLRLEEGQRLMLTGPSGAGKTVLLRALALLDPWQAGRLFFHGEVVPDVEVPRYRARVTYLHQRPVLFEGTVRDNITLPTHMQVHQHRTLPVDWALETVLENLEQGAEFLDRPASRLSGGEGQVVALVRAMLIEGDVLLLDEPTSSIDERTTESIEGLIEQWMTASPRRAFIWVTHDRMQWKRMGGERLVMRRGKLEDPTEWARERRRGAEPASTENEG